MSLVGLLHIIYYITLILLLFVMTSNTSMFYYSLWNSVQL